MILLAVVFFFLLDLQQCYVTMEGEFPGPFCKEINLSCEQLSIQKNLKPLNCSSIKNGVVFEISNFLSNSTSVVNALKLIQPASFESSNISGLRTKLNRLNDVRRKFLSKKKVKGANSWAEFLDQPFNPPTSKLVIVSLHNSQDENTSALLAESMKEECSGVSFQEHDTTNSCLDKEDSECQTRTVDCQTENKLTSDDKKSVNLQEYEYTKKTKSLTKVENEIQKCKDELKRLQSMLGHYSVSYMS